MNTKVAINRSYFLTQTECKLKTYPRYLWDSVRKNKSSNRIPYTVNFDEKIGSGSESISSLFFSYFSTVHAIPSPNKFPDISFSQFNLSSNCSLIINDVELGLSVLKTSKFVNPDDLLGTFLYNIRSVLYFPLWLIFRLFLETGTYPSMFETSSVTAVYKTGNKTDVDNCRPLSIQNHIAKL